MTFTVTKASDWDFKEDKTFTTLEELKDYITAVNDKDKSCVIYFDSLELLIYDDWIE